MGPTEPRRNEFWKLWVFNDPNWDWRTFDFDRDLAFADTKMAVVNSVNADLRPFKARNGKLVMYHGWADGNVPAANSIEYFERVKLAVGGSEGITDFFRLFLVPGMGHCSGGGGPNTFDAIRAIERWVEHGKAPEQMIASKIINGVRARTRPLCPYPQIAKWKGSGSTDDAVNFACVIASPAN